jgi:hypothetical protein
MDYYAKPAFINVECRLLSLLSTCRTRSESSCETLLDLHFLSSTFYRHSFLAIFIPNDDTLNAPSATSFQRDFHSATSLPLRTYCAAIMKIITLASVFYALAEAAPFLDQQNAQGSEYVPNYPGILFLNGKLTITVFSDLHFGERRYSSRAVLPDHADIT